MLSFCCWRSGHPGDLGDASGQKAVFPVMDGVKARGPVCVHACVYARTHVRAHAHVCTPRKGTHMHVHSCAHVVCASAHRPMKYTCVCMHK